MNKKLILSLPIFALILSGCVMYNGKPNEEDNDNNSSDSNNTDGDSTKGDTSGGDTSGGDTSGGDTPTGEVTTYLVLGEYGLYKGNKGNNVESLFLENTISYVANVGSVLPTKDDVTSTTSGSTFVSWCSYEGNGSLVNYTTVPAINGKILYASFSGGKGSGTSTGDDPVPSADIPTTGYGIMFNDGRCAIAQSTGTYDVAGRTEYKVSGFSFKKDDMFQIYDFSNKIGWLDNIDAYSFRGDSTTSVWESYLSKGTSYYTVLKDIKADVYIKLLYENNLLYISLSS